MAWLHRGVPHGSVRAVEFEAAEGPEDKPEPRVPEARVW